MSRRTDTLIEQAVKAVLEAGKLLTDPAAVRSIRSKSETDYVTDVDLAVQELLQERLAALAPAGPEETQVLAGLGAIKGYVDRNRAAG